MTRCKYEVWRKSSTAFARRVRNVFSRIRLKPVPTKGQFLMVLLLVLNIGVCRLPMIKFMYIYVIVFRFMYANQLFSRYIRYGQKHTAREQLVCLICMHHSWNTYEKMWLIFTIEPGLEMQMVENILYIGILIMFIKRIESDDSVYFHVGC